MKGLNQGDERIGTAESSKHIPHGCSRDAVEGLFEVVEDEENRLLLFSTLSLNVTGTEDHVDGDSGLPEALLRFW